MILAVTRLHVASKCLHARVHTHACLPTQAVCARSWSQRAARPRAEPALHSSSLPGARARARASWRAQKISVRPHLLEWQGREFCAVHQHTARRQVQQAEERHQQRRLAAARPPHHADLRARGGRRAPAGYRSLSRERTARGKVRRASHFQLPQRLSTLRPLASWDAPHQSSPDANSRGWRGARNRKARTFSQSLTWKLTPLRARGPPGKYLRLTRSNRMSPGWGGGRRGGEGERRVRTGRAQKRFWHGRVLQVGDCHPVGGMVLSAFKKGIQLGGDVWGRVPQARSALVRHRAATKPGSAAPRAPHPRPATRPATPHARRPPPPPKPQKTTTRHSTPRHTACCGRARRLPVAAKNAHVPAAAVRRHRAVHAAAAGAELGGHRRALGDRARAAERGGGRQALRRVHAAHDAAGAGAGAAGDAAGAAGDGDGGRVLGALRCEVGGGWRLTINPCWWLRVSAGWWSGRGPTACSGSAWLPGADGGRVEGTHSPHGTRSHCRAGEWGTAKRKNKCTQHASCPHVPTSSAMLSSLGTWVANDVTRSTASHMDTVSATPRTTHVKNTRTWGRGCHKARRYGCVGLRWCVHAVRQVFWVSADVLRVASGTYCMFSTSAHMYGPTSKMLTEQPWAYLDGVGDGQADVGCAEVVAERHAEEAGGHHQDRPEEVAPAAVVEGEA